MFIIDYISFILCFGKVMKWNLQDIKSKEDISPLPPIEEVYTRHLRVRHPFICGVIASFSPIKETKARWSMTWQWQKINSFLQSMQGTKMSKFLLSQQTRDGKPISQKEQKPIFYITHLHQIKTFNPQGHHRNWRKLNEMIPEKRNEKENQGGIGDGRDGGRGGEKRRWWCNEWGLEWDPLWVMGTTAPEAQMILSLLLLPNHQTMKTEKGSKGRERICL